jgi:hypothetical protein
MTEKNVFLPLLLLLVIEANLLIEPQTHKGYTMYMFC